MSQRFHLQRIAACAAFAMMTAPLAMAQQATAPAPVSSAAANNTAVNQRDAQTDTLTPTDQPNDRTDIKLAAAVRQAIVKDDALSMSAHNVKLVAANGVVTLRGPVASADEKAKVEAVAASVEGVTRVDNQLDVKN